MRRECVRAGLDLVPSADSAPQGSEIPSGTTHRASESVLTDSSQRALDGIGAGPSRLLTLNEAAQLLRVHRSTLDRERRAGRLACVRIGRRVLFSPDQVRRYLQQQEQTEQECQIVESLSMQGTGSSGNPIHPTSTSSGAARARDAFSAGARVRTILTKLGSG